MTYMRRYALSAMLGIVTEEDTDGEFNFRQAQSLSETEKRRNRPTAEAKRLRMIQGKQKRFYPPQIERQTSFQNCLIWMEFHIEIVTAQDGRECVLATGNTAAKKELLSAAGFHWNPQRKIWWKYAA